MELSKQEMKSFLLFPDLESKNYFDKISTIFTKESNLILHTGDQILQTGIEIIQAVNGIIPTNS